MERELILRKKKLLRILKKIQHPFLAVAVILFGAFLRIQNLPLLQGRYLLALDPYIFLKYARSTLAEGSLMAFDPTRYYPLGFDVSGENMMVSHVMVWMYKIGSIFSETLTIEEVAIIYPVIFFALGLGVFYLLNKTLFNKNVALLATAILAVLPPYLYRTMAGFSDKEPLGMFLMFSALYFFLLLWKTKSIRNKVIFGISSGLMTGLMGMTWGGFKFLLLVIPFFAFIALALGRSAKGDSWGYLSWAITFSILATVGTKKYGGLVGLMTSTSTAFAYIVIGAFILAWSLKRFDIFVYKKRIITISAITIPLVTLVLFLTGLLVPILNDIKSILLSGMGGTRLMMTVAEAKVPYLVDWISIFGLFFFIFTTGIIYVFYLLTKPFKWRGILTVTFGAFIAGIIGSRISPTSLLDGNSIYSTLSLFIPVLAFAGLIIVGYIIMAITKRRFPRLNESYLFLLSWFIIMAIAARSGMRLFLVLAPVASTVAAFMILDLLQRSSRLKDNFYKYGAIAGIIILTVPQILAFTATSFDQARYYGPSFNSQWIDAMEWVKTSTPEDAVFAHWWDYGYWVQAEGNRATITDGGNFIPYWNHLMGRHVLAAQSEEEALEFLFAHDATHLLIISDEIGKYQAYSSIGSDENFDIFSWIGTFVMDPFSTTQDGEVYNYNFQGGVPLDEDIIFNDKVFPQNEAYILGFRIPVRETDETFEIQQPVAFLYHNGVREDIPVKCIYDEGIQEFEKEGLDGCIRIFPRYLDSRNQQENGALLYISEKGRNALWTRLFIFDEEIDGFNPVYDDGGKNPLVYAGNQILGPLRVWEIEYPEGMTIDQDLKDEYLGRTTPEWMNLSSMSILAE